MGRPRDPLAREELLAAAVTEFVAHGLEGARVEDITARAGRSKGSFYLHFKSKEEAFQQIVEALTRDLDAAIMPPPQGSDLADAAELLLRAAAADQRVFEFLWERRAVCRMVLTGAGSMDYRHLVDGFAEKARASTLQWLRWGQAQGLYRDDVDLEVASMAVAGAYDRVARAVITAEHKPDIAGWVSEVSRLVTRGLGTPRLLALLDGLTPAAAPDRKAG